MPELLKNHYTPDWIAQLGLSIHQVHSGFNQKRFLDQVLDDQWEVRELKARTGHIAEMMKQHISGDYSDQIAVLSRIAPQFKGLKALVFPTFVELYGLDDYQISIKALEAFTTYSTAEFAIRPFIVKYPDTMKKMLEWSKHDNFHVRRLASEGCRPLLPWAMKLKAFEQDPTPILPILENLRNDPEDYVYRSVANNLNDISKNHPELVLDYCESWINESKTTRWVCKHGLRTLLKKGNQRAMQLFGFGPIDQIDLLKFELKNNPIKIGDGTTFELILKNTGAQQRFRLEYAIGYLKKAGHHNEKVFQIKETTLKQKQEVRIIKKLLFKNLTTRKHYNGQHYIYLIINGKKIVKREFELVH